MFRSRSWFGGSLWKNKNPHSLEHLKYLYNVLSKNNIVTENNRSLLVETLRSIAEILIWGDQNDSSVFDFFLEKNMLSFFLKILKQKCGSYVCVQLLQTLNILFENIRNETSLYYLLSNNHVNSIIVHKFDFSDEEIMAYYISFLKTLSLKLNSHTIHFFYNDHTNDFPLYTEAIKFFKHPESMVRIAVRTLTLNVYRVRESSMLRFIRNKTAVPYFSNLVWFIGNHVIELDTCVRNDADHSSQGRLADLVAEHLDHLHYLNDILCLNIEELNDVLVDHLLNKLFIPLYIYSLLPLPIPSTTNKERPLVSVVVSLFLLSQVFIITRREPLVHVLCQILLRGTLHSAFDYNNLAHVFIAPPRSLEESLDSSLTPSSESCCCEDLDGVRNLSITDEEKEQMLALEVAPKIFLDVILSSLDCLDNDYSTVFSLSLLYAMSSNSGIGNELLSGLLIPSSNPDMKLRYNSNLVQKLINIISLSCQSNSQVRLITLELAVLLLEKLVVVDDTVLLSEAHLNSILSAREESITLLRNYYKKEEIFGDMFESEDEELRKKPLNVEWLMMDSNILLPPTVTPLTGIQFNKRLPCGEVERTRKAIRNFLIIRRLCNALTNEVEAHLPLTNRSLCVQNDIVLDLTNSDLLSCHIVGPDGVKIHRFLVVEASQIILVVPVQGLLGYGQPKLSALLHDIEVAGDKQDSKSLFISAKHTTTGSLINTKFIFDDAIRCMAAQQRLFKGRMKARDEKMRKIERLLDIPVTDTPPFNLLHQLRHHQKSLGNRMMSSHGIPIFPSSIVRRSSNTSRSGSEKDGGSGQSSPSSAKKWREGPSGANSPKLPRPRSEEIQLERMSKRGSKVEEKLGCVEERIASCSSQQPMDSSGSVSNKETSFSQLPLPIDQSQGSKWKVETV